MARRKWLAGVLVALVLAGLFTGWKVIEESTDSDARSVVLGTADEVGSLDPASGYNVGSWMIFNNVFQTLLTFPHGASEPAPEAAEQCAFTDSESTVYRCGLKEGLTFSNGHAMTAKDVAYSFERTLRINDEAGPAYLLSSIDRIETPDERTVVFHLKSSDATFPFKIASNAGAIVDHRAYPPDELRTDGEVVGSGVYTLDSFGERQAVLTPNERYRGQAELQNSGMTVKYFTGNQRALRTAVQDGSVDLAYRGLAAGDIAELENATESGAKSGVKVVDGQSTEIMHMIFNMDHPVAGREGVRKAIAHLVDRQKLVSDVYEDTAEPLYSVIPTGITGHTTPYFDTYGDRPRRDLAAAALEEEDFSGKVPVTFWVTPNRFGPATVPAFEEIAEQLNDSGLFRAEVKSVPLDEYEKGVKEGRFGFYVRGWLADYPDPDIFVAPFFGKNNIVANGYRSPGIIRDLLPATTAEADRAATVETYERIQSKVADDLPVLPLWQGRQYTVARDNVYGSQWSVDSSTVPRFWELLKSE